MDIHKKFTFDDPEDSWWNDSSSPSARSFFEDPVLATTARQALDALAGSREQFSGNAPSADDATSIADSSDRALSELDTDFNDSLRLAQGGKPSVNLKFNESNASSTSGRKIPLSTASVISDCSISSFQSDATVHLDYSRLKSEHRKLQKHLEHVRAERYQSPPIHEAIKRLKTCQPVALDFFRAREEKTELLDAAIASEDRDVITYVVLFLKRTLINTLFREVLIFKPAAAEAYVGYLRASGDHAELIDTLFALGRSDEAAMTEFVLASRKKAPEARVHALKQCLVSGFSDPTLMSSSVFVREYVDLLERQMPIDAVDEDAIRNGIAADVFRLYPKKSSLIGQSLLTSLYYCCLYHYDLPKNAYASPLSMKEFFGLGDREFAWMAISALARLRRYTDLDGLLTNKKLIVASRISCPISWLAFFSIVFRYDTPPRDLLNKWLRAVSDLEERLRITEMTTEARDVQLETIIALKDRRKLTSLISKLTPHSGDYNKAQMALANAAYKWKN